ncbi:DUF427 domain-containing protein [Arthrobacter sulfonylureivorans]|uniref:DUF427 domain-containing protein n=1 Tax=Arthrobacter sulfonylureivorans TaxID=2486855 RepID=A0ABY3WB51_9MICC|nr:DUF427 domain-containing protein [Arthrobacter sulfonylureivorans]UNK46415.1 DUF427 domain-containing protein [Arthrobacter sulfonylureivorans]
MEFEKPFTEPTGRRIRVRLGGGLVADSARARLLVQYGRGELPTYYLPREDVAAGALANPRAGSAGQQIWDVALGSKRAEAGAWEHPNPTGELADLAGHVTFSWRQLEWYEEDERALVHARDPYKRVDTLRSSRRVQIYLEGQKVADSIRPLLLFETYLPVRYYLPAEDVRTDLLEASDTVTSCPYKGMARYWSVRLGQNLVRDVMWSYPDPIPENPKIRDLFCFFNERVDLVVDGAPQDRPETPWS